LWQARRKLCAREIAGGREASGGLSVERPEWIRRAFEQAVDSERPSVVLSAQSDFLLPIAGSSVRVVFSVMLGTPIGIASGRERPGGASSSLVVSAFDLKSLRA